MRRRCRVTGKVRFGSAVLARIALNEAIAAGRGEIRRYECQFCGGWNLTSQPWKGEARPTIADLRDAPRPAKMGATSIKA